MDENSNFRKENEGEFSAFSTEHLTVGYDKMPLIKDVNLQVRPGEILTLIGPNGSGKSTILKTITRQLKQIGGTVYLGKETMRGMGDNEVSRRLSMVMTERVRTELMSGREVVASGRYPYTGRLGILSPEDWEKVDEAIALVHAKEVQEQDFMKISDGQRQRLMLARAIAQDTKILVLDEPTSYLDMGFKLDILANIRLLARERNLAIVMSLHELDLAQKISDTIACVKGDRIDRIGTPEEIFAGDYVQKLYGVAKENFDPLTGQVFFRKMHRRRKCLSLVEAVRGFRYIIACKDRIFRLRQAYFRKMMWNLQQQRRWQYNLCGREPFTRSMKKRCGKQRKLWIHVANVSVQWNSLVR